VAVLSPVLSACDFFLWGFMKSRVFKAPVPHTVQELKYRIQQEVKCIPVEILKKVMAYVCKRLNGSHLKYVFGK
jgi:hypothetical protein